MSEDYSQQQPIALWNTARGVWETTQANLLCEHWELFSETWPISGMMRNGQVFELPMPTLHTTDSESSSQPTQLGGGQRLPTPTVADQFTANLNSSQQSEGSLHSVSLAQVFHRVDLFPTPNTMDHLPARSKEEKEKNKGKGGYANVRETVVNDLMPTPTTRDYKDGTEPHERDGIVQTDTVARAIFNSGEVLLPTTRTSMANGLTSKEIEAGNPKSRIETEVMLGDTNWGKFEPAIRRWEEVLGRPAPAPTKPDGKDNAHRLSSKFTEWMMGLPDGWITDIGLSRNDELKACGNGVVPQQAELALRLLLERKER